MTQVSSESRAAPSVHNPPPFGVGDPTAFGVAVTSEDPSAWMVEVRGELDIATGPILKQALESYNAPSGSNGHRPKLVYLLSELEFMDARGLHYLLTALDGLAPETITIREPSPFVSRVLGLVGLDSMIEERANQ